MKNKKLISIFVCLLASLFMYAETEKLDIFDSIYPHETFIIKNNKNELHKYRMQMQRPYYSYYVDVNNCKYVECFPSFEIGITTKDMETLPIYIEGNYTHVLCNILYIIPDIIMKSENLKDLFSIRRTIKEEGYFFNCTALSWEIYEKGLVLDIVIKTNDFGLIEEQTTIYLELKDDGKNYETENTDNFGKLRKKYSDSDFFYKYFDNFYRKYFSYNGCTLYKMKDSKRISRILVDEITFYNQTEDGIEFITPYGCGFFDFETESISQVSKEKYIGKEFSYMFILDNHDYKGKKARKIITEKDLNPPDIKIPLEDEDIYK